MSDVVPAAGVRRVEEAERLARWRLVLGADPDEPKVSPLDGDDEAMDRVLAGLYDADRSGGLGRSSPQVARWLAEVRSLFPRSAVHLLQHDALDRLSMSQALLERELIEQIEPDVQLVATLLTLSKSVPGRAREAARVLVTRLVDDLRQRLTGKLQAAVRGALHRAGRTARPRPREIDWDRTIRKNLQHYHPAARRLVAERLLGRKKSRSGLRDVILCLDQSGSMAASVVYAGVLASALASMPALRTRLVVFDTSVVDLSDKLHDPVELLFGVQLGGGTEIARALSWCETLVTRPNETILILVSDLHDGGDPDETVARARALKRAGVKLIVLLALSDLGAPAWDVGLAARLGSLGVPCMAVTPERFAEVLSGAILG